MLIDLTLTRASMADEMGLDTDVERGKVAPTVFGPPHLCHDLKPTVSMVLRF